MAEADSWSQCESLVSQALADRQISESNGWTISLDNTELSGLDYVFDSISSLETPPAFPTQKHHMHLISKVRNDY